MRVTPERSRAVERPAGQRHLVVLGAQENHLELRRFSRAGLGSKHGSDGARFVRFRRNELDLDGDALSIDERKPVAKRELEADGDWSSTRIVMPRISTPSSVVP